MRAFARQLAFLFLVLLILQQGHICAQSPALPSDFTLLSAIESTLLDHPLIRSQHAQVQISRGLQEQASGPFNSLITSGFNSNRIDVPLSGFQQQENTALGVTSSDQATNNTNYAVGVQRLFRDGISVNTQFQLSRLTDNLFNKGGVNTSTLNVALNIPLMRGRGRAVVAAQEQAAKTEVDATLLDLNQLISQLIANTASSYWNLVAARKNLAIAVEAEDRGSVYLHNVRELVDADHVPSNDLHEVTANLAQRSSTRLAAEQQVVAAQEQLALDMGMSADRMLAERPSPADDFPRAEGQELPSDTASCMEYYAEQALRRRADYLASERRSAEAKTLLNATRNRLLPQVDLNFSAGYYGLRQGRQAGDFFGSTYTGVPGPNAAAGITYSFPENNQLARGELMQSQGLVIQADVQSTQLARAINSSVVVTLEGLRSAIVRAKRARESVESFQSALTGEREKYAGGIGSIVDILSVEDRLTAALSDQVESELAYALAVTQFRFATGTLVRPNEPVQSVPADTFFSLPFMCTLEGPR